MKARTVAGIACAFGVVGSIVIGSRAVKIYDWRTEWTTLAPMPVVYEAMTSREAVREWWPDMENSSRTTAMTTSMLAAPSLSGYIRPPRWGEACHPSASIASTPT